jgi:hypothetical protein
LKFPDAEESPYASNLSGVTRTDASMGIDDEASPMIVSMPDQYKRKVDDETSRACTDHTRWYTRDRLPDVGIPQRAPSKLLSKRLIPKCQYMSFVNEMIHTITTLLTRSF